MNIWREEQGAGSLGDTSALSRARAPLGLGRASGQCPGPRKKGLILSSPGQLLPLSSTPRGVSNSRFLFPGQTGAGVEIPGEVACGAEERGGVVQPARSHWQEQASARKDKPSCPCAGALGGHSLSFQGPGPLAQACQPWHLPAWAQAW